MKAQIKNKQKFLKVLTSFIFVCLIIFQSVYSYGRELIPLGKTVGITVELKGVFVVNTAEFEDADGKICSPAEDAGIRAGDIILNINGADIISADVLEDITDSFPGGEAEVVIDREGKQKKVSVTLRKSKADNKYKLGLWIKDSSSGIGTLTCFDPESMEFVALGHGICDFEERLTPISTGNILEAEIASIKRGESGVPGELIGVFGEKSKRLGSITNNTNFGIKGFLEKGLVMTGERVETAERDEVTEGPVTILSNIEGKSVKEYSGEILKINKNKEAERGMVIKITDEHLIEKTGGIVRGMSGSPILQNGRIVGAVTHVFVNDPTRGYGIFIENMLSAN